MGSYNCVDRVHKKAFINSDNADFLIFIAPVVGYEDGYLRQTPSFFGRHFRC